MNEPSEKQRRRWPRWFRYSLRTLLLVILVASIWLGWWTNKMRKRHRAIEALQQAGVTIYFHHEVDAAGIWVDAATPPGPAWLRWMSGDEFFFRVRHIYASDATDETMAQLAHLDDVQVLSLSGCKVTAAGLSFVRSHKNIEFLLLDNTLVTDAALHHLRDLERLELLWLSNTEITDAGLNHLSGLKSLRALNLRGTNVTDAGLKHLPGLDSLEELHLDIDGTRLTPAGVEQLRQALPQLEVYGP